MMFYDFQNFFQGKVVVKIFWAAQSLTLNYRKSTELSLNLDLACISEVADGSVKLGTLYHAFFFFFLFF